MRQERELGPDFGVPLYRDFMSPHQESLDDRLPKFEYPHQTPY